MKASAKYKAICATVPSEIHAPALMRAPRLRDGPTVQTHVLAPAYPHAQLQAFQPIPAIDAPSLIPSGW